MYSAATTRKVFASSEDINYRGSAEYYAKRRRQADYFSVLISGDGSLHLIAEAEENAHVSMQSFHLP